MKRKDLIKAVERTQNTATHHTFNVLSKPKMSLFTEPFLMKVESGKLEAVKMDCVEFNPNLFFETYEKLRDELYGKATSTTLFEALENLPKTDLLNFIRPLGIETLEFGLNPFGTIFLPQFSVMFAVAGNYQANYFVKFQLSLREKESFDISADIYQTWNIHSLDNGVLIKKIQLPVMGMECLDDLPKSLLRAEKAFATQTHYYYSHTQDLCDFESAMSDAMKEKFRFGDM